MIRDIIRKKMIEAMKAKDKKMKDLYAYILDQIQKAEKAKQSATNPNPVLTEAEELAVIQCLVKQARSSIAKTKDETIKKGLDVATIAEFIADKEFEIIIYSQFLPQEMTADEIKTIIQETANGLSAPINKGILMKNLMPKVKGKADGKLVATLVDEFLKSV